MRTGVAFALDSFYTQLLWCVTPTIMTVLPFFGEAKAMTLAGILQFLFTEVRTLENPA